MPGAPLQLHQVRTGGSVHGGNGYRLVEGDEAAFVSRGQREQIGVGDLAVAVEAGPVDRVAVEKAGITRPELVMRPGTGMREQFDGLGRRDGARIARLADDAHETVLGDGAGGPPRTDLVIEPARCPLVIDVIAVQKRE